MLAISQRKGFQSGLADDPAERRFVHPGEQAAMTTQSASFPGWRPGSGSAPIGTHVRVNRRCAPRRAPRRGLGDTGDVDRGGDVFAAMADKDPDPRHITSPRTRCDSGPDSSLLRIGVFFGKNHRDEMTVQTQVFTASPRAMPTAWVT